jgi:hypothetical protein
LHGLREGYGIWREGSFLIYEGEFKNDFKHGKGIEHFKNGD